jgi:PPOX class probable F420-dependent enzyme
MPATLPGNVKELIDRANFAHLATLMEDGSPHSTPVWVGRDGDRLMIGTSGNSLKARNTKRDPRVAISMVDFRDPYMEAQLRGRVVEHRSDSDLKILDAISVRYTGKAFPMRGYEDRVALVIEIDKVRYLKLPFEHTPSK